MKVMRSTCLVVTLGCVDVRFRSDKAVGQGLRLFTSSLEQQILSERERSWRECLHSLQGCVN